MRGHDIGERAGMGVAQITFMEVERVMLLGGRFILRRNGHPFAVVVRA